MSAEKINKYACKYSEEDIKNLSVNLLDYAENAKSIHLAPWCHKQGFSRSWLLETIEHYSVLKEAYEQAKELIAAKIVNTSFYNQGNDTVGMQYLPVYDSEFKELLRWKEEIKKPKNQKRH